MWFRPADRKLELSTGGKWYVAFTILVGLAAVSSGNNVIYLMESLLLGVMVVSGLISEHIVKNISLVWQRGQARAGETMPDVFLVKNQSRLPVFGLEVGVLRAGSLVTGGWLPVLEGGTQLACRGVLVAARRGEWKWDRMYVATSFPFGLGKKIRFLGGEGSRLVWPRALTPKEAAESIGRSGSGEIVEGEVRELGWDDDFRLVHGPLSARSQRWMGRVRGKGLSCEAVELRRCSDHDEWEREVARAAGAFYRRESPAVRLVVIQANGRHEVDGRVKALNWLALERP